MLTLFLCNVRTPGQKVSAYTVCRSAVLCKSDMGVSTVSRMAAVRRTINH